MFLKTSISTTKKLIQKTLYNVKYLFSGGGGGGGGGYQKIPKTYTEQKRIIIMSSPPPTKEDQVSKRKEIIMYDGIKKKYEEKRIRDERSYLVAQKLNELKMLENYKDEPALDIEQVLYYYSRLTCPAYVEIVDKFFMQIYSELFGASTVN